MKHSCIGIIRTDPWGKRFCLTCGIDCNKHEGETMDIERIQKAIDLIEPYLEEESFPPEDIEMWKGVLAALNFALGKSCPELEKALLVLRSVDYRTKLENPLDDT